MLHLKGALHFPGDILHVTCKIFLEKYMGPLNVHMRNVILFYITNIPSLMVDKWAPNDVASWNIMENIYTVIL